LYGLGSHHTANHVPSSVELDSVTALVGFGRIRIIDDTTVALRPGTRIDLGGIVKGSYFVKASELLREKGMADYLVNIGGDLICSGVRPDATPWIVGVRHPRRDTLLGTIRVSGASVFTSGDYERFFISNGLRYHHLFDPKTGRPGRLNQSVTIIGNDPLRTDAAAKTAFLLPADSALRYLSTRNMAGLIVDSDGKVFASAGLRGIMTIFDGRVVGWRGEEKDVMRRTAAGPRRERDIGGGENE
jgi:thiamine biosynthesis lipoprotein